MTVRLVSALRIPTLIATITFIGLLSALLGDGIWNVASWCLLAVPLIVIASALIFNQSHK